jgi:hypothetical protein
MNKNAIQKFAIWARNELIAQVSQRAYQYGIDESGFGDASADTLNGRLLTAEEKSQRQELIKQIKEKGYKQVMEEVAYTWFNRFIALRFMEVNNYLPSHIRVFSDASGAFKPEILNDVLHLDLPGLDSGKVAEYIESNDTEALYRYLLLTQCNALNSALPVMFERMGGYTEMLLPNNILRQDSVLGHMVSDIPEENWQDAVQIIGWLYQYYNTELKDDTFAQLKKNVKITKERIPAATQLFTPDWIVRYMVENSLGRLWLEGHPNAELRGGWKYYLDEAEQEPEVEAQLTKLREEYKTIKPEEIKVIDPCMGSGHILVYAFDVLMQIYTSAGWDQREAAQSILKNNLFGLDIDDRAAQLAYFAVMMKARQYDRRFLTRGIQPHIYAFAESNTITTAPLHDMGITLSQDEYDTAAKQVLRLLDELRDAKEYGSILTVTPCDWDLLRRFAVPRTEDEGGQQLLGIHGEQIAAPLLQRLINIGEALSQQYDVVVTNPPYMGASGMNARLAEYVKSNYPNTKSDMSTVFMEKTVKMCKKTGYMSMINIPAWMFLSSYEKLRESLIAQDTFANMVHFGRGVFGSDFGTTAFVIAKAHINGYKGTYCRLFEKQGAVDSVETKEKWFLEGMGRFVADQSNFSKIPGSPVAYWVNERFNKVFEEKHISDVAKVVTGMTTADNERFLRLWFEISLSTFSIKQKSNSKWFPYQKGGDFCKWYGDNEYVVNWENNGLAIKNNIDPKTKKVRSGSYNESYITKKGLTWTYITSGPLGVRFVPDGFLFDNKGSMVFFEDEESIYTNLGFLCGTIARVVSQILNPTISFQPGNMATMPSPQIPEKKELITSRVKENIQHAKIDWDSYETSWDFKRNPLV